MKRYGAELPLQAAFGVALGYVLSRSGFSDYDQVARMFRFGDFRLLTAFVIAVLVLVPLWGWAARRVEGGLAPRPLHPGSAVGGLLFGAGWALGGACPSIALVQVGEGKGLALCTVAGILLGNWLYSHVHQRWFRWSVGSCASD